MRIALSGLCGAGSSTTAKLVSERLGLPMCNMTFRALAQERGVPFEVLQEQSKTDPSIDFELDRRLLQFIEENESCLVATDLACWLDVPSLHNKLETTPRFSYDYKIWLEVPLEERARRMHNREKGSFESIRDYNHTRDLENRERYLAIYGVDIFDHSAVDWVFDTSALTLEEVVTAVCSRIEELALVK